MRLSAGPGVVLSTGCDTPLKLAMAGEGPCFEITLSSRFTLEEPLRDPTFKSGGLYERGAEIAESGGYRAFAKYGQCVQSFAHR